MKLLLVGITENAQVRGVERYVIEHARAIAKTGHFEQVTLLAGAWQGYYEELVDFGVDVVFLSKLRNKKLDRHLFHILCLKKYSCGYDIVHICNTLPFNPIGMPNVLVTIHDLAEFFVPEKYGKLQVIYRRMVAKFAVKYASDVITVSNFSKKVIVDKFKVKDEKVTVAYNGCQHLDRIIKKCPELVREEKNYFLYWGAIEKTKGLKETISAFDLISYTCPDVKLVVVGQKGNAYSELEVRLTSDPRISYLGYVDDYSLVNLIYNAKAILFPSQYEGFGFPAIEAFMLNHNVISSNTTALGEITQEFAVQVNPVDVNAIASAMKDILSNPLYFDEEKKASILRKFSWDATAEKFIELSAKFKKSK